MAPPAPLQSHSTFPCRTGQRSVQPSCHSRTSGHSLQTRNQCLEQGDVPLTHWEPAPTISETRQATILMPPSFFSLWCLMRPFYMPLFPEQMKLSCHSSYCSFFLKAITSFLFPQIEVQNLVSSKTLTKVQVRKGLLRPQHTLCPILTHPTSLPEFTQRDPPLPHPHRAPTQVQMLLEDLGGFKTETIFFKKRYFSSILWKVNLHH